MEKGYSGAWISGCLRKIISAVILIFPAFQMHAQPQANRPARILFLLDASSSMLNEWTSSENRFNAAARIINTLVDSIHKVNSDVAFAVRVFGNQYPAQDKNCYDTRLEVPFNLANDLQIRARLKYLKPMGYSPIAWSLKETAEHDFTESNFYSYSIILITDGGESCGGDICATVTNLLNKKISFKPYILSLIDDAPLKQQYDCLGKYLTVAKEQDIVPAIRTIIDDNRKILTIRSSGLKPVQPKTIPPSTPVVQKPSLPSILVKKEEPVIMKKEEPKPIIKEEPKPVIKEEPPVILPKISSVDRIRSITTPRKMNLLYTLPEGRLVNVPKLNNFKVTIDEEPKQAAPSPNTTAANPPKTNPGKPSIIEPSGPATPKPAVNKPPTRSNDKKSEEKLDFIVKTEDAKESTLQIYFTNGQGKFYRTEPKMQVKDSKSGKEVKTVYRNVTPGGEPDPIKLDPGTYDILIPGARSKANGVVIEPGKNKKYYIKVRSGSLAFYYPTAPNRPVKEYTALVSKRFEQGPVVKQKCDEELPYEPTNYHIEINTLPPMMLNVDLDFNNVKLMSIPEPGSVQITNRNNMGKVQFWYQHGETYVPFYEMMISGNPAEQKVDFLPGLYQIRYYNGPASPLTKADVVLFRVVSNKTTTIELGK